MGLVGDAIEVVVLLARVRFEAAMMSKKDFFDDMDLGELFAMGSYLGELIFLFFRGLATLVVFGLNS